MGTDYYVHWRQDDVPEWGAATPEKVAAVAMDFLGEGWTAEVHPDTGCLVIDSRFPCTFHLASERPELKDMYRSRASGEVATRGFEIWFDSPERTRITTRSHWCDSFTSALVRRFIEIIAKWWNGEVEWPS